MSIPSITAPAMGVQKSSERSQPQQKKLRAAALRFDPSDDNLFQFNQDILGLHLRYVGARFSKDILLGTLPICVAFGIGCCREQDTWLLPKPSWTRWGSAAFQVHSGNDLLCRKF